MRVLGLPKSHAILTEGSGWCHAQLHAHTDDQVYSCVCRYVKAAQNSITITAKSPTPQQPLPHLWPVYPYTKGVVMHRILANFHLELRVVSG